MVIGSDSPSFVLYDSGKLIYHLIENRKLTKYIVNLTQNEMNEFIENLSIDETVYDLDDLYMVSNWTDQPYNKLYLSITVNKQITVYGNLNNNEDRNNTPSLYLDLYDKIKNYRNENAIEWIPPKIEIMFWDYDYAPNKRP
jgi:hypothetical protein